MFLLIGFEAMLIVEHLFADLANRGERLEPVVWDTKSRRRICIGGGDTERRRSICSCLLYVISCAKSAFCAKELQSVL